MNYKTYVPILLISLLFRPSALANALVAVRHEMTVLKSVLYRGGGLGGMRSMPSSEIKRLCERGMRTVYYLYPESAFSNPGTHQCSGGQLEYKGNGFFPKQVRPILRDVYSAALNGTGPVLVHCWNGSHAAGEVAAYALMQFCGWSGDRAATYWQRNILDPENMHIYRSIPKRIRTFRPFAEFTLPDSIKSQICPH